MASQLLYLSGAHDDRLWGIENVGAMTTPMMGNRPTPAGVRFGIDNGCFSKPEAFNLEHYLSWIRERPGALFATAPDKVGDAEATLAKSLPVLPLIREAGAPAALVA